MAPAADPAPAVQKDTFSTGSKLWTARAAADLPATTPTRVGRTPIPLEPDPRYDRVLERLKAVVTQHAGDPDNPWAIGHGLLAMGPDFQLTNQQPAVDWLFSQYAEELPVGEGAEARSYVRFPTSRGSQRIEPHTGLMLKVLAEVGVDPQRTVQVQGHPHPVADLYRGVLVSSYLVPERNHSSFQSPNDLPWALQGLATWAPPGPLRWEALDGTPMSMDDLTAFSATVLMAESQFLFEAMQAGASFEKKGQGIFAYTCGGAHLLQGTAYAVARGHGGELVHKGLLGQVPLLYFRFPRELQIYDSLMKKAPQHAALLLVQRLKFVGHFLESAHKMAAMGLYRPSEEQQRMLQGAAQQLVLVVEGMEQQAIFDALDALRTTDEQMYLDVVGDSAHAIRGLELALGRGEVRY